MENERVKPGRMAARASPSCLSRRTQNEWNVEIRGGRSRFISSSSEATRARISPAALFVNVTARTAVGGTCFALIRCEIRCVITRVLPLPAPARIRTGPSVVSTASRCWGLRPERKSTTEPFSHRWVPVLSKEGAMRTKANLSGRQYEQMLRMLAELTPAERASLKDPEFITEDEADIIVSDRRAKEPGWRISIDELFAELGIPRRRRA